MDSDLLPIERATRRALLLIILLQSIGIRALPMQGVASGVGACLIMVLHSRISVRKVLGYIFACLAFLAISSRGMTEVNELAYLALGITTAALFVHYTGARWAELEDDLLQVSWWLCVHGLVSFLLFLAIPGIFGTIDLGGMEYRMLGPFIVRGFDGARATGLCWEPGLFQYVGNVCLLLSLKRSVRDWRALVPLAAVVASHSTAGIFGLVPSFLYLLVGRRWSGRQTAGMVATVIMAVVLSVTVFRPNIEQKLSGTDTSGLIRLRDLKVGWDLFTEKPLEGHGQFDEAYLGTRSEIYRITDDLFSKEFLADNAELTGGYTNGMMSVLAGYGLLLGGLMFWCFYNNQLIQGARRERVAFFAISMITFISERITVTSWFFVIAISGLVTIARTRRDEVFPECP